MNSMEQKKFVACLADANDFFSIAHCVKRPELEFLTPYIVNLGFCCELYLKAICMKTNPHAKYTREHCIDALLDSLPTDVKSQIESAYSNHGIPLSLQDFLKQCNCPFVQWRYEFEKEKITINISALDALACTLNEYCKKLVESEW